MAPELPADLIWNCIFPLLPAVDIHRSRLLGKSWNLAYQQQVIGHQLVEVQATRGGQIPVGFLLKTDEDQKSATRGTGILRSFKRLEEVFPGRQGKVLATCNGVLSVYLRDPAEFLITNPLENILMNLNKQLQDSESNCVGMAVFPVEGVRVPEYIVAIPYRPAYLNQDVEGNPMIRFWVWGSRNRNWDAILHAQQWLDHPQVIELENWETRNVVQIGEAIYYHLSENDLVCFDLEEGEPAVLNLTQELLEAQNKALCIWEERLSFMVLQAATIYIYSLENDEWIYVHHIQLQHYVSDNRFVFRSNSMTLRNRPSETPVEALEGALIVGYAEPEWLLIRHGVSFVLINLGPDTSMNAKRRPRRINPKCTSGNFFFTHRSSLIRVAE